MRAKDLLRAVGARAPWRMVVSPLLKIAGFDPSRGLKETLESFSAGRVDGIKQAALEELCIEHSIVGEKQLRIYPCTQQQRALLRDWGDRKRVRQSDLTDAWLTTASDAVLAQFENSVPQFVKFFEDDAGAAIVFVSSRAYLERVELSKANLKGVDSSRFERIFASKKTLAQVYDAIWIPADKNVVCLLTGAPEKAPAEFSDASVAALKTLLRKELGADPVAKNLWPAIQGLYDDREGQFVENSFATDGESVKNHKGRRGGKCLRKDPYHVGGSDAVDGNVTPYRISVLWKRKIGEDEVVVQPEVQLPGSSRTLHKAMPSLDYAYLRHCLMIEDLQFVVSKLAPHLK